MSGHLLRLHTQPALSIDLHTLHPERLRGLSATEVSHLPLRHGRDAATVGDFCHVSTATDMPDTLTLDGDFSRFHRIGQGLTDGRIVITGSVGDLAGAGVQRVVDQLAHHRGRALDHLAGGDLADQLVGQFAYHATRLGLFRHGRLVVGGGVGTRQAHRRIVEARPALGGVKGCVCGPAVGSCRNSA